MSTTISFDELLDAIEQLPVEQQTDLVDVLQRRLASHGRQQGMYAVQDAREEHRLGKTRAVSADELKRELGS